MRNKTLAPKGGPSTAQSARTPREEVGTALAARAFGAVLRAVGRDGLTDILFNWNELLTAVRIRG